MFGLIGFSGVDDIFVTIVSGWGEKYDMSAAQYISLAFMAWI